MATAPPQITLEPARPIEADAAQVMAWRNDPVTLAVSYHHEPKVWDSFWPEFVEAYFPEGAPPPAFAVEAGRRVGFLRFVPVAEPDGTWCVDLSINVAPAARGQGRGRAMLAAAEAWLREAGVGRIHAEVRVDNAASRRSFEAAGYRPLGELDRHIEDTGETARIIRYRRDLT